ncbi:MAG: sulfatase [Planctomycetota bacterium]
MPQRSIPPVLAEISLQIIMTAMRMTAFLSLALLLVSAASAQQPNVLLIVVDDLRPALGCYGDAVAKTPNIDAFASTARVFDRAYCQQAVCGPSRASLLTGRLPDNLRVWHNRNLFRATQPDLVTLPQHFKNHGYHTAALGKVFSGDERELDPASWSEPEIIKQPGWRNSLVGKSGQGKGAAWEAADVADDGYPDGKLANVAIEKLQELQSARKPFFMAVGFFKPHLPFNAPKRYWDLHDPSVFEQQDDGRTVEGVSENAPNDHRELGGYRDIPDDEHLDLTTTRTLRHGYYACVSYTDAQIGKLLSALEQKGLAGNTIVVLCADHGYALGEKDRWCKGTNFEHDTRVPLIIRSPGMKQPGARSNGLVELVDLYPTLASLASLPVPDGLDGRNLKPMLEDPQAPGQSAVLSQFARPFSPNQPRFMGYSLRTDTHRYTRWISWPDRNVVAEELYDYRSGPSTSRRGSLSIEERNIADDAAQSATRETLGRQLDQLLQQRIHPGPLEPPEPSANPKKKKKSKGNR